MNWLGYGIPRVLHASSEASLLRDCSSISGFDYVMELGQVGYEEWSPLHFVDVDHI